MNSATIGMRDDPEVMMGKGQRHRAVRQATAAAQAQRRQQRWVIMRWLGLGVVIATAVGIGALWLAHRPAAAPAVSPSPTSAKTMTITTPRGTITIALNSTKAPNSVARIAELAGQGFYNGLKFHRVCPSTDPSCGAASFAIVQGGDPNGDGSGGSGQQIAFEANDLKHTRGAVALARGSDRNSADSQFYIVKQPQPALDEAYVVFGQVTAGMEVVDQITAGDQMTSVTVQ